MDMVLRQFIKEDLNLNNYDKNVEKAVNFNIPDMPTDDDFVDDDVQTIAEHKENKICKIKIQLKKSKSKLNFNDSSINF
ncbi:hypothetical protein DY138_01525 [Apilactobacillus timberlakei]|uniref:hypothetical protein n=1 Tax=Apilactobacillus timberlakei TaxID=2008380 RepID=UPI0011267BDD|nr:hypothetical protein [Apilactobacillus timberlakei]TPR20145.1 hypothetical protein DY138_01525 [Apilactobacillus timberlakei]TPR21863.1 hypothetical protein DY061_01440 [Apilactobacillus timberlakei]TPR22264.1 hypothetical protein DY083_04215 [Apilactobacillus timberlakei]TPR24037.1 hypothetical protein DY102_02925 [Apilactobacillus timberlakei]